jgi:Response regulators consisting of a CheY-like receiver domain and a winged-helix DNA-binding domain
MEKKKILIIEDDKYILENLALLLESENYGVMPASDGFKGVILAEKFKPDLIISDIMMPGFNGYDVLHELNKKKITPNIPFIFLTAKVEHIDFRKGMILGADDYIHKPFLAIDLLNSIKTRLLKSETVKSNSSIKNIDFNDDFQVKKYKEGDYIHFNFHNSKEIIKSDKIKYIKAENQYSEVYFEDNRHILIRKSMCNWEKILPSTIFLRIHRSTIINIKYVGKIIKSGEKNYLVTIKNSGTVFTISRRYAKLLKEKF